MACNLGVTRQPMGQCVRKAWPSEGSLPFARGRTYLPTLTACWNVGRFWKGYTLGAVTPAVTRARLAFQHEGWGSVTHAPAP